VTRLHNAVRYGSGRQGAGLEELLGLFDALCEEQAGRDADAFNDDETYQGGINQARRVGRRGSSHECPTPFARKACKC
jgi:hypothetical protein